MLPPIGSNQDLVRALTGRNPRGVVLLPPGSEAINANGELIDRWGTPYHIHQISSTRIDFRSAGPDRVLFSADDIMTEGPDEILPVAISDSAPTATTAPEPKTPPTVENFPLPPNLNPIQER